MQILKSGQQWSVFSAAATRNPLFKLALGRHCKFSYSAFQLKYPSAFIFGKLYSVLSSSYWEILLTDCPLRKCRLQWSKLLSNTFSSKALLRHFCMPHIAKQTPDFYLRPKMKRKGGPLIDWVKGVNLTKKTRLVSRGGNSWRQNITRTMVKNPIKKSFCSTVFYEFSLLFLSL